jgi:hypothetical protein
MAEKRVGVAIGVLTLAAASLTAAASWGRPQVAVGYGYGGFGGYGVTPYNYNYGGGFGGIAGFGGFGSTPYNYSYGIRTGQPGVSSFASRSLYPPVPRFSAPQVSESFQPLYNLITTETDWNRPPRVARRHRGPSIPRERLVDDQGKILWPADAPDGPSVAGTRRVADAAVRAVVDEGKRDGHASIRGVIGAKARLTDYARKALPDLKARDAAGSDALEAFIVELGKTLESMAAGY